MNSSVQVLFPGGITAATFDVSVINDEIVENNEIFGVSIDPLSLPFGVFLGDITYADVQIIDDDGKPQLDNIY